MTNPFDDPEFCRAYDYYVTVEQPRSWADGYRDGWADGYRDGWEGTGFHDEGQPSEDAYRRGYDQGVADWVNS